MIYKKVTILILSLFVVTTATAQRDTVLYKAGTELIKYEKSYSTGIMLQLAGSSLVIIGSAINTTNKETAKPLIIGGGVLALVGFFTQIASNAHIKKAGMFLRGDKLIMPIRYNKKR